MATDLATPSNTTAKIRWHEQYVSEGLNKKLNGIIPAGVVRGGRLGTSLAALSITIEADPNTGDSIYSYIDANGHQVTFRQVGDVTLSLSGGGIPGTTIYIGLEITYVVSAATVVKWRAFSLAEVQANPNLVVLGRVDVPAAGVIPASDIYPEERREAWTTIAPNMREWRQGLTNGSFETCLAALATSSADDFWPDWDLVGSYGIFSGINVSVVTGSARTGDRCLQLGLTGVGGELMELYWAGQFKVFPGQLVSASVWARGSLLAPGPGANGVLGLRLTFLSRTGAITGTRNISDVSPAFIAAINAGYAEVEGIVEVPANSVSMWVSVIYNDDNQNSTGTIYIDDVRVFLETGEPTDEYPGGGRDDHLGASIRSLSLDIPPQSSLSSDIDDLVQYMLRFRQGSKVGNFLRLLLGARDGSSPFDLTLQEGSLDIERQIYSIGANLIGSAVDAALPRVEMPVVDNSISTWMLVDQYTTPNYTHMRVYVSELRGFFGPSYAITMNAEWTGTQWKRDGSGPSYMRMIQRQGFFDYINNSTDPSPWADVAWRFVGGSTSAPGVSKNYGLFVYDNGLLSFSSVSSESNPTVAEQQSGGAVGVPNPNTLIALSTPKAWCHFLTGGPSIFVDDAYNIEYSGSSPTYVGTDVHFDFLSPLNAPGSGNDWYAVVASGDNVGSKIITPYNLLNSGFDLTVYTDAGAIVDLTGYSGEFMFIVFGRQNS